MTKTHRCDKMCGLIVGCWRGCRTGLLLTGCAAAVMLASLADADEFCWLEEERDCQDAVADCEPCVNGDEIFQCCDKVVELCTVTVYVQVAPEGADGLEGVVEPEHQCDITVELRGCDEDNDCVMEGLQQFQCWGEEVIPGDPCVGDPV